MSNESESPVDEQRRRFLKTAACVVGGVGAICTLTPFVASMMPSKKAQLAAKPLTVDLSQMQPGQQLTVRWRGKPVWIIRRTPDMMASSNTHRDQLRDPDSIVDQQPAFAKNAYRSIDPEYLILVGICTHLGCSPQYKLVPDKKSRDWPGGFFCPCHGSRFDLSGRVYKGMPAPINLEVPPHHFISQQVVVIGENAHE